MPLKQTYIQYGVPSDWAKEYETKGLSAATFKQTTNKNLIEKYRIPLQQVKFVKTCLYREPINEVIVQQLLENNNFLCCLCKGTKSDAYIIHHLVEYSKSQDNSYSNLALLCPNDHDLAHRGGNAITNKITVAQIRLAKKNWESQIKKENKIKALKRATNRKKLDWKRENIFKELQAYTENDKDYFFGRSQEIKELLAKIFKYNIVGLFGESGTGKTSLLNAGLIPVVKDEDFIVISIRCLDEPIKRFREELFRTLKNLKITTGEIEKLTICDTFPHLIIQLISLIDKENRNIFIIIDQFEELFTRAREEERSLLSKGITEALNRQPQNGKICFLISLREDYIGELWEWAHNYKLEEAWIHQFRIKRLDDVKAFAAITEPLQKSRINVNEKFVYQVIDELKRIGDNYIYPPYLQIVCSILFERYKNKYLDTIPLPQFGEDLYDENENAESIISEYLSESLMEGLTEEEKINAQLVLDLLTGPEGLRTFLNAEEISRYSFLDKTNAQHIIEHLIKKKVVHPIVGEKNVTCYELVHDFLSKKFFDKLGPEVQRSKTTIEIFRKAFREWKQHGVLASRDRLEILLPNIQQLILTYDEWIFLIKSSFSIYWSFENNWTKVIDPRRLKAICLKLIYDKDDRIVEHSIDCLGETKSKEIVPVLIEIIEAPESSASVKERAIVQFYFNLFDIRIIKVLRKIIQSDKNIKLRKAAVYAFGRNLAALGKLDKNFRYSNFKILYKALNDSKTQVRKQAADILSYDLITEQSIDPLLLRLKIENAINSRKAIVSALGSLLRKGFGRQLILPVLKKISSSDEEDYRVKEEARFVLKILNGLTPSSEEYE
jgi:hypothetical protein